MGWRIHHVVEIRTPVAEVGADNECIFGVLEVRQENLTNGLFLAAVIITYQDGDNGRKLVLASKCLLETLVEVGKVHFEGMFGRVLARRDVRHITSLLHFLNHITVDNEVAEWRGIFSKRSDCTSR